MTNVGGNTGSQTNIVQAEASDERLELEEDGKRLPDTSAGTQYSDLRLPRRRRGEHPGPGLGAQRAGGVPREHDEFLGRVK